MKWFERFDVPRFGSPAHQRQHPSCRGLNSSKYIRVLFVVFSSAFSSVSPTKLIGKPNTLGFEYHTLWLHIRYPHRGTPERLRLAVTPPPLQCTTLEASVLWVQWGTCTWRKSKRQQPPQCHHPAAIWQVIVPPDYRDYFSHLQMFTKKVLIWFFFLFIQHFLKLRETIWLFNSLFYDE